MNDMFKKITNTVTIVFPAVISVFGILKFTGVVQGLEVAEQIVMILLGAVSAVCSIWFNKLELGYWISGNKKKPKSKTKKTEAEKA